MWVFAYGSLMWDRKIGCSYRANVPGVCPRPQQRFEPQLGDTRKSRSHSANGSCVGIAFRFPHDRFAKVQSYLTEREGGFTFYKKLAQLEGGEEIEVQLAVYESKYLMNGLSIGETALRVKKASGRNGPCTAYVIGTSDKLKEMGIEDSAVKQQRPFISWLRQHVLRVEERRRLSPSH
jgi:cation transport protein ChaC